MGSPEELDELLELDEELALDDDDALEPPAPPFPGPDEMAFDEHPAIPLAMAAVPATSGNATQINIAPTATNQPKTRFIGSPEVMIYVLATAVAHDVNRGEDWQEQPRRPGTDRCYLRRAFRRRRVPPMMRAVCAQDVWSLATRCSQIALSDSRSIALPRAKTKLYPSMFMRTQSSSR